MIKIILVSWFISQFEPLQLILDRLFSFIYFKTSGDVRTIADYIHTAFGCMKCLAFWIGLFTGGFFFAAMCGLIGQIIQLCLRKLS